MSFTLRSKVIWHRLDPKTKSDEVTLEFFVGSGLGTNDNPTRNASKGDLTTLIIFLHIVVMKGFRGSQSNKRNSNWVGQRSTLGAYLSQTCRRGQWGRGLKKEWNTYTWSVSSPGRHSWRFVHSQDKNWWSSHSSKKSLLTHKSKASKVASDFIINPRVTKKCYRRVLLFGFFRFFWRKQRRTNNRMKGYVIHSSILWVQVNDICRGNWQRWLGLVHPYVGTDVVSDVSNSGGATNRNVRPLVIGSIKATMIVRGSSMWTSGDNILPHAHITLPRVRHYEKGIRVKKAYLEKDGER